MWSVHYDLHSKGVHTDLIVAQANHGCDNGLPMIEAIAALMFGKFDYKVPM